MKKTNSKVRIVPQLLMTLTFFLITPKMIAQRGPGQQESIFKDANVIPPSPNATAFNKFIDIPVSHYTGVPNINIPIYTLTLPQFSLPISLNYHAGGLKVGEHSSWIGAGWSLNAGGAINRTVRGLPDEYIGSGTSSGGSNKYGFLRLPESYFKTDRSGLDLLTIPDCSNEFPIMPPTGPGNNVDYLAQGFWDSEPDLYHFSFPGGSGKFVFNRNRDMVKFSVDDNDFYEIPIDLEPNDQSTIWNLANKRFRVKDASGITYTFAATEITQTANSCGLIKSSYGDDQVMQNVSSWQLTRMERAGNWIDFTYTSETITYNMDFNESRSFTLRGTTSEISSFCRSNTVVYGKRLKTITTSNGYTVEFIADTSNRRDRGFSGSKRLKGIKVKKDGQQLIYYELGHGYFGFYDKLKLEHVQQVSNTNATTLPGYNFSYHEEQTFPSIDSYQQDYWGYFNGAIANDTYNSMIPDWKNSAYHVNLYSKASREPKLIFAKQGTIKKITYPTGGYSEFEFELHDSYEKDYQKTYTYELSAPLSPGTETKTFTVNQETSVTFIEEIPDGLGQLVQLQRCTGPNYSNCTLATPLQPTSGNRFVLPSGQYKMVASTNTGGASGIRAKMKIVYEQIEDIAFQPVGGLRIRKVKFHDPVNQQNIQKIYDYSDNGKSSGKLFTPPWIGGSISTYTPGSLNIVEEFGIATACIPDAALTTTKITLGSSASIPIGTYQGSHVGYGKVQEIRFDAPFLFRGTISDNVKKNGMVEYQFINDLPQIVQTEPYIPAEDLTHKNGKPLRETTYKYVENGNSPTFVKLLETQYEYVGDATVNETNIAKGINFKRQINSYCYACSLNLSAQHIWNTYTISPKWHPLKRQVTYSYDENGQNPISTYQQYTYNINEGHYMYASVQTEDSENDILISELQRVNGSPALIAQKETFKEGNPRKQLSGEIITYHGILPATLSVWNRQLVGNGSSAPSSMYEFAKKYTYDSASLLLESTERPQTVSRQRTAYLWGYKGAYVIAAISNITPSELDVKLNDIGVSRTGLTNNTSTVFLKNNLLQLRSTLTENDQLMTMYLFDTPYGISETHDPNGRISRYEYDEFGRLLRVKDHDQNVLRENEYNFSN